MKSTYALVTGASSGMGLEFARLLAAKGYNLLMVSNEEAIHERAAELSSAHSDLQVESLVRDLSKPDAARELYDYTHAQGIEIEVLINNEAIMLLNMMAYIETDGNKPIGKGGKLPPRLCYNI